MVTGKLREEIKEAISAILEDFDIFSREDFEDSMEFEPDLGLIDVLIGEVLEEFEIYEEDMDELLDEVLDEMSDEEGCEIVDRYYEIAEEGGREEGIKFLDEYIKNASNDLSAEVLSFAGNQVLMYTEDLGKGIRYFHMAMEKEPENPDIYWTYFTDLDEITDEYPETIDDAILCLTKIIEICRKIDDTNGVSRGRYDYIDRDFNKDADIARRYWDLAEIYLKIPDYEKAEECIDKTLATLPDNENAILTKNKILVATGREQQAVSLKQAENDGKKEIRPDKTIIDPLLKLEEIVEKISGCYTSIPEDILAELNHLTGNEWTEEEYIEFCAEYWSRSTLEETVYALLHNGVYPENREKELYIWKAKREVELTDEQIMFKLRKLPDEVDEDVTSSFEDLSVGEFYEWLCTRFPEWEVEEDIDGEELQSGSFEVDFSCDDIDYAIYKYALFEAYGNKLISLHSCNLYDDELQAIQKFVKEHGMHLFEV